MMFSHVSAFDRRTRAAATTATLLVAGLAASGLAAAPAQAASVDNPIMVGAVGAGKQMILDHEAVVGERVNGLRVYKMWDSWLFNKDHQWARDTGHTLFLSIRSARMDKSPIKWNAIAAAQPGDRLYDDMLNQARQIKNFGAKVYIVFNHEPEAGQADPMGSSLAAKPAEYVAAWRKVIGIYRTAGVTNAEYVFTATARGFNRSDVRDARPFYPGDAWVDHIASDGYNWGTCRNPNERWRGMAGIIGGHRKFGQLHPTKSLMLLEWGSAEDANDPMRKARWINDVQALFKQSAYDQFSVLLQWQGRNIPADNNLGCRFDYASSTAAQQAWAKLERDPAYSATAVPTRPLF